MSCSCSSMRTGSLRARTWLGDSGLPKRFIDFGMQGYSRTRRRAQPLAKRSACHGHWPSTISGDPEALRIARQSVSIIVRTLHSLFYVESDRTNLTTSDLKAQADKIFDLPPEQDMLKWGLYLVHDIGILSL